MHVVALVDHPLEQVGHKEPVAPEGVDAPPGVLELPNAYPAERSEADVLAVDLLDIGNPFYNGDGGSNIADAVAGLSGLFGGGGPHVLGDACAKVDGTCEDKCQ